MKPNRKRDIINISLIQSFLSRCVLAIVPGNIFLTTLCCLAGLVMFSYYASLGCDPHKAGYVNNANQVMYILLSWHHIMKETLYHIPVISD